MIIHGTVVRLGVFDSEKESFLKDCKFTFELPIALMDRTEKQEFGQIIKLEANKRTNRVYAQAEIKGEHEEYLSRAMKDFGLYFALYGRIVKDIKMAEGALITECIVRSIVLCGKNSDIGLESVELWEDPPTDGTLARTRGY